MNGWKRLTQYLLGLKEDELIEQDKIGKVKCAVEGLSVSDKTIILKRYGIEQERQYTLKEIAAEFKATQEAIRQREARIFQTLRREIKRR